MTTAFDYTPLLAIRAQVPAIEQRIAAGDSTAPQDGHRLVEAACEAGGRFADALESIGSYTIRRDDAALDLALAVAGVDHLGMACDILFGWSNFGENTPAVVVSMVRSYRRNGGAAVSCVRGVVTAA